MPQSLTQIYLHTIFSTKNRKPFLTDQELRYRIRGVFGIGVNSLSQGSFAALGYNV